MDYQILNLGVNHETMDNSWGCFCDWSCLDNMGDVSPLTVEQKCKRIWDELRPLQRRVFLEGSLSESEMDNPDIQETIDFVVFREFEALKPDLKKSVCFMMGL